MDFKSFLRTLMHGFVSAAIMTAATTVQSGAPITSGNVLLPSLLAGALGMAHAMVPSTIGAGTGTSQPSSTTVNFPSTK